MTAVLRLSNPHQLQGALHRVVPASARARHDPNDIVRVQGQAAYPKIQCGNHNHSYRRVSLQVSRSTCVYSVMPHKDVLLHLHQGVLDALLQPHNYDGQAYEGPLELVKISSRLILDLLTIAEVQ
jgi:hypothetical protein